MLLLLPEVLISLPDVSVVGGSVIVGKLLQVLYTNADQFVNKRDLLLAQIAGKSSPNIIVITEMLPKAPSSIISSSLFALPGYSLYANFDPDNYSPLSTNIRGVGIFVSNKLESSQVFLQSTPFMDHVSANIKLQGSDSLLIGGVYRSLSCHLNTSVDSLCNLLSILDNYTHLLICGDFNFREISWSELSGSTNNCHIEPFLDVVDDLFLFQHVCQPTRFRQK